MSNLEKLLAAGASVIIRPCRGIIVCDVKYGIAVEYQELRQGLIGNDLEEMCGRGLEWVDEVKFYAGVQWTPEQLSQIKQSAG